MPPPNTKQVLLERVGGVVHPHHLTIVIFFTLFSLQKPLLRSSKTILIHNITYHNKAIPPNNSNGSHKNGYGFGFGGDCHAVCRSCSSNELHKCVGESVTMSQLYHREFFNPIFRMLLTACQCCTLTTTMPVSGS